MFQHNGELPEAVVERLRTRPRHNIPKRELRFDPELGAVLNFSEMDLYANQHGVMTPLQRQMLRQGGDPQPLLSILLLLLTGGFVFTILVLAGQRSGGEAASLSTITLSIIFGLMAVGLLIVAATNWGARKDAEEGRVMCRRGWVTFEHGVVPAGSVMVPYQRFKVDNVEYKVPERAFKVFQDGKAYHIYFAPRSKILMSAEPA